MRNRVVLALTMFAVLSGLPPIATADQNPPWVRELPTVAAVQAAIHGANPHDTAVRVSATLELLQYFTAALSGESDLSHPDQPCSSPGCAIRHSEYESAKYMVLQKMISGEPPAPA